MKESVFINGFNAGKQVTKLMNIEKGVDIDTCWDAITNEVDFSRKRTKTELERRREEPRPEKTRHCLDIT